MTHGEELTYVGSVCIATMDVRKEGRHTGREQEEKNMLRCDVLQVSPLTSRLGTNSPVCDEGVFKRCGLL